MICFRLVCLMVIVFSFIGIGLGGVGGGDCCV